jgi:tetratricopeptide (TPR) repeat protein
MSKPAKAVSSSPSRKLPLPLIGAVIGILVLLGGGWFAWTKYQKEPEEVAAPAGDAIIARATTMISVGKYDDAIKLLQDIKPNDPVHDQALLLIADIRNKRNNTAQLINGIPVEQYYTERVAAARTAFASRDYTTAKIAFDEALRVRALPPEVKEQYDASVQQVAKLTSAKSLFAERKYAEAITNLQQLLDQDPRNVAIQRLLTDAHFNNATVALQAERTADAIRELDQVLKVNPNDETAKRARELAARYDQEPKDLLYKIYVKYLPLRQPT